MPLKSKRPVAQASRARMQKVAEHRIRKHLRGSGVLSELAKIIGPLVIKEGVKIGSSLIQKKIAKKKRKKGTGLRPAGARPTARRRVAPMPRPRPRPAAPSGPSGTGRHKKRRKKKKKGRMKY